MELTQSLVKDIESKCPRLIEDIWIAGNRLAATEPMDYGNYFEYRCLGGGATSNLVTDLPRLRSGEKSADHKRIDIQVDRFLQMFEPSSQDYCGWKIISKQEKLSYGGRAGTIDFLAEKDGILAIFDLKLTGSLSDGYWSTIEEVDMVQMVHYQALYASIHGITPDVYYLVFDYSTKLSISLIKVNVTTQAITEYEERFSNASEQLDEWMVDLQFGEFPRIPNPTSCNKCRLNCGARALKEKVTYLEITI